MKKIVYIVIFLFVLVSLSFILEKYEWLGIFYNEKWNLASIELEHEISLQKYQQDSTIVFKPRLSSDRYAARLYIFDKEGGTSLYFKEILNGFRISLNEMPGFAGNSLSEYEIGDKNNKYGIVVNPMEPKSISLLSNLTLKRGKEYNLSISIPSVNMEEYKLPKLVLVIGIQHRVFL